MPEKRRYFRIADTIGLSFKQARPVKPDLSLSTSVVEMEQRLASLDAEINSIVNRIWSSNPELSEALGLLNRKIDLLTGNKVANKVAEQEQYDHHFEQIEVSLSASGVAFDSEVKLDIGDRLDLMLVLKPSNMRLQSKGTVVNVAEKKPGELNPYVASIDFDLVPQDEERLIQHIVQRQVQIMAKKDSSS